MLPSVSIKISIFASHVLAAQVANIILQQLGGNRFITMTGVKNLVSSKSSLQFDMPRSPKVKGGINKVSITLNSNDTYNIIGYRYAKLELTKIQEMKDVQASNLKSAFTSMTGYHTSL